MPLMRLVLVMAVCLSAVSAQLTSLNTGSGGPTQITSTGGCHTQDNGNFAEGVGSVIRDASAANSCYFPTRWAIDPTITDEPTHQPGFTIMFWYRPVAASVFQYVAGDRDWLGVNGAFRIFQNGVAGVGNLIIRGPLTQLATTGAPLQTGVNGQGWVHVTLRYDRGTDSLSWLINGVLNNTSAGAAALAGTGTDFSIVGYNGSAAPGPQGGTDDYRLYNHWRSDAEIAAEWNTSVTPTNIPTQGHYSFDFPLVPQVAITNVANKSTVFDTENRVVQTGDVIEWAGQTDAMSVILGSAILNLEVGLAAPGSGYALAHRPPPAMATAYSSALISPVLAGLEVGHGFSNPALQGAIIFPDALNVGPLIAGPLGLVIDLPPGYLFSSGGPPVSGAPTHPAIGIPPGLPAGSRIHLQWVGLSGAGGLGVSQRATFLLEDKDTSGDGAHAIVEAMGQSLQTTSFWEIHNTGDKPITQLTINVGVGTTPQAWETTGALNSGGTFAVGDSIRFLTDQHVGYTGFTTPGGTATDAQLIMTFNDFDPGESFIFDCDFTAINGVTGDMLDQAMVTMDFDGGGAGTITVGPLPLTGNAATQSATLSF